MPKHELKSDIEKNNAFSYGSEAKHCTESLRLNECFTTLQELRLPWSIVSSPWSCTLLQMIHVLCWSDFLHILRLGKTFSNQLHLSYHFCKKIAQTFIENASKRLYQTKDRFFGKISPQCTSSVTVKVTVNLISSEEHISEYS